jgi:hypothetical protein
VSPTSSDVAFVDEVLRLNARYLDEVVERFDFCPYARTARQSNQVARAVLLDRDENGAEQACASAIADVSSTAR